ncbi:hypothetical protein PV-S19_0098 [Pacmanvirus S19]|nr:hypothetical protein PV-S19_0098 [Pacmanvirus S19]
MIGLIIALIIVVTLIIVLGVYFYKKTKDTQNTVQTPVTTTPGVPQYVGCYVDGPDGARAFSGKYRLESDFATCALVGKNVGAKYIGFQGDPKTGLGTCWYGDSYDRYGKGADCVVKDPSGNTIGQWDIAVYQL